MTKYYYHKRNQLFVRKIVRWSGLFLFCIGFIGLSYVFYPLLAYQMYLAPVFAAESITTPIPVASVLSSSSLQDFVKNSVHELMQTNSSDAATWFPGYTSPTTQSLSHHVFFLSIPKLGISNAIVSNVDNDLDKHLVNFGGTAFPPANGNSVVFGHSTLPQWFNPHDYKAIFATVHTLQTNDKLIVTDNGISYNYLIDKITIVDADDTSALAQQYDDSYLTLITCTPPGTVWKRLVIHSRLAKLS